MAQGGRVRTTRGEGRGTEDRRLQGGGGRRIGAGMPQPKKPVHDNLLFPPFAIQDNKSDAKLNFNCYVHEQAPGSGNPPLPRSGKHCPGAAGDEGCHPSSVLSVTSCVGCGAFIPAEGRARLSKLIEWRERFAALDLEDQDKFWQKAQAREGLFRFRPPAGHEWVDDFLQKVPLILCDSESCCIVPEPPEAASVSVPDAAPKYKHLPSWCWLLSNTISWLLIDDSVSMNFNNEMLFMVSQLPAEISRRRSS